MEPLHERTGTRPVPACPTRRFAGWLPAGMVDWPGKVTATMFLAGCTFACPYCHNPALRGLGSCAPDGWKPFVRHLREKRAWLDGVVVTGGEPTEDPDLPSLLAALAEEGLPVKVDTNGANPAVLSHVIAEDLVAYVAMDVKTTWERYDEVTRIPGIVRLVAESAGVLLLSEVRHEFRTTLYPGVVDLEELPRIAEDLAEGELYALQQFRPERTLQRRAAETPAYTFDKVLPVARRCNSHIPTIVRGL
ncbi:MAG: anaerobic ribonucleoside-triphosphate reductase activating protein [Coriobacteriia bacterium]|nr:anaerobic ribonucleoside-triphosphate reductase activating protein [Coriobacteriia bacterium]